MEQLEVLTLSVLAALFPLSRYALVVTLRASSHLFFFFLLLGGILYRPVGPDQEQSWVAISGAFALFLAFACAIDCAGSLLWRGLRQPADRLFSFTLGVGAYAFLLLLFGLFGWIGYFPHPLLTSLILLPPILQLVLSRKEPWLTSFSVPNIFFFVLFLVLFSLSWIPNSMPDPLWYHLTSARWWMDEGKIFFPQETVTFFWTGTWDQLYVWAAFFVGVEGDGGLIAQQIFGQWIHFFFAGITLACALCRFYQWAFPRLSFVESQFVTLVSLLSVSQLSTLTIAKNDWGASLFALVGALLLAETRQREGKRTRISFAGFFLGLAFASKMTCLFAAIPLYLFIAWRKEEPLSFREAFYFFFGFFCAALPHFLRNYLSSGNPIFPSLGSLFPTEFYSPSFAKIIAYEGAGFFVRGKGYLLKNSLLDSPLIALSLPLLLPALFLWRRFRAEALFLTLMISGAVIFFLKVGILAEFRFFGLGCFLLSGAALIWCLAWAKERRILPNRYAFLTGGLILVGLLYWVKLPIFAPFDVWRTASPPEVIRKHFGGTALAWVRLNLPPSSRIASTNEAKLFYLSSYRAFRIFEFAPLDRALYQAASIEDVLRAFEQHRIEYLIHSRMDWDVLYREEILDWIEAGLVKAPKAILFKNENSSVIHIPTFAQELTKFAMPENQRRMEK